MPDDDAVTHLEVSEHSREITAVGAGPEPVAAERREAVAAEVIGDEAVAGIDERPPHQRPRRRRDERTMREHERRTIARDEDGELGTVVGPDPMRRARDRRVEGRVGAGIARAANDDTRHPRFNSG
jgi:hypothetical protein